MTKGAPNMLGGVNLRRLERGEASSRMLVAGMDGIGAVEKSIFFRYKRELSVSGICGTVGGYWLDAAE